MGETWTVFQGLIDKQLDLQKIGFPNGNGHEIIVCRKIEKYWNTYNGRMDCKDDGTHRNDRFDLSNQE